MKITKLNFKTRFLSTLGIFVLGCGAGEVNSTQSPQTDESLRRRPIAPWVTVCRNNLTRFGVTSFNDQPCRRISISRIESIREYHILSEVPFHNQCEYDQYPGADDTDPYDDLPAATTWYAMCGWGCGLAALQMAVEFVCERDFPMATIIEETECWNAGCGVTMPYVFLPGRDLLRGPIWGTYSGMPGAIPKDYIVESLQAGFPVMTGMNLAEYQSEASQEEEGAHWLLVVGYALTDQGEFYYVVNDPLVLTQEETQQQLEDEIINPTPAVSPLFGKRLLLSEQVFHEAQTGYGWAIGLNAYSSAEEIERSCGY